MNRNIRYNSSIWITLVSVGFLLVWTLFVHTYERDQHYKWIMQGDVVLALNKRLEFYEYRYRYTKKQVKPFKKILFWNKFYGENDWEVGLGSEPFRRLQCKERNCEFTDNREKLNESDAVLFHIHELTNTPRPERLSPHQRWVFWMLESPGWSNNDVYKNWNGLFNWTMTYRLDSDIRLLYGDVKQKKKKTPANSSFTKEMWQNKKKEVAWMVSNCGSQQSKREEYVSQLKRHINVDVYGRCGTLSCARSWEDGDPSCLRMVEENYKFYLAFENSLCKEYVTEKFFKILPLNVIPVVRGAADYSKFAPKRWYIDAKDFKSAKELAAYLREVGNNFTLYSEYLKGRESYDITTYFGVKHLPSWCDLCQKLHDPREPVKVYDHIDTWWSKQDCVQPSVL